MRGLRGGGGVGAWQDLLPDEAVEQVLQFSGVVRTVDYESFIFEIELSLGAQFAPEVLCGVGGGTAEGLGHLDHVNDDRFDAVTFALHLGHQPGHLVAVEDIADVAIDVDAAHGASGVPTAVLSSLLSSIMVAVILVVWLLLVILVLEFSMVSSVTFL